MHESRGLGDVYKRQLQARAEALTKEMTEAANLPIATPETDQ